MNAFEQIEHDFSQIPRERKERLKEIATFISEKVRLGQPARLIYICTHNSRRSHMSQLWAQVAADHFGIQDVRTFSGGTEATCFEPRAVAALQRAGFEIKKEDDNPNPTYHLKHPFCRRPQKAWSKVYSDETNPQKGFAAIMTCSSADQDCPIVHGAEQRFVLPYEDPKKADDTLNESTTYDERCRQIATEMFYCFSLVVN